MSIRNLLKRLIYPNAYSVEAYKQHLRKHGVLIGEHTQIYSPNRVSIDIKTPYMIKIGDYCAITQGVHILGHDYSRKVLRKWKPDGGIYFGGRAPVTIGDNVFIGINSIILMGTTIGNNCVVGAGAVVKGNFPDNCVIAGNPAKVICSIDDYYARCERKWQDDAMRCARAIYENSGRLPERKELSGFAWMFTPHTKEEITKHPELVKLQADDPRDVEKSFLKTKPLYNSFEEFLEACGL